MLTYFSEYSMFLIKLSKQSFCSVMFEICYFSEALSLYKDPEIVYLGANPT